MNAVLNFDFKAQAVSNKVRWFSQLLRHAVPNLRLIIQNVFWLFQHKLMSKFLAAFFAFFLWLWMTVQGPFKQNQGEFCFFQCLIIYFQTKKRKLEVFTCQKTHSSLKHMHASFVWSIFNLHTSRDGEGGQGVFHYFS